MERVEGALTSDAHSMEERKHHIRGRGANQAERAAGHEGLSPSEEKGEPRRPGGLSDRRFALCEASMPSFRAEFAEGVLLRFSADPVVQYLIHEGEGERGIAVSLLKTAKPGGGGIGGGGGGVSYAPSFAPGPSGPPPGYFSALAAHDANQSGLKKLAGQKPEQAAADFEHALGLNPLNPEYAENLSKARAEEATQKSVEAERGNQQAREGVEAIARNTEGWNLKGS